MEAVQANETLLSVVAVTRKSPGVDGGVEGGGFGMGLAEADEGTKSVAAVNNAAISIANRAIFLRIPVFSVFLRSDIICVPFTANV